MPQLSRPLVSRPFVIAIDGPSASGKGTIARRMAAHYDFAYLDTGLLYRASGVRAGAAGVLDDTQALTGFADRLTVADVLGILNDPVLRGDAAALAASKVGANAAIRAALLKFQKDFAASPPDGKKGAVLDGRDIGTVIAPHADVKIYVTADVAIRASRRWKELQARGETATEAAVLADLRARDARDANRAEAPCKPADDAVLLDTSTMDADKAFAEALAIAQRKLGGQG